jgi:hypothetical protein
MNAARFYWDKLEGVNNVFKASEDKTDKGLDYFQNICCELINEFRCPRLVQIEALVSVPLHTPDGIRQNSKLTRPETPLQMLS